MGKKNTETAESGEEGERLHFSVYAAECAWSCAFNEESKPGRQEEKTPTKTKKRSQNEWKEERKLVLSYVKTLVSSFTCDQMWSVWLSVVLPTKAAHLRTPHISHALGKNQLNEEETRQNPPLLSAPLCSANPWWSFQVVHKLAHNNSRLHRNYILLTVRSFVCVSTVCYNTGTRLEPNPQLFRPLVGGIEMFLSVLCEIIS